MPNHQLELAEEMPPDGWELEPDDPRWPESVPGEGEVCERIYGLGDWAVLSEPCISIIGARRGTPYGLAVAQLVGRISAENGLVVVSGGALGCDSEAMRSAIAAGGRTVFVAGCGADRLYPRRSKDVYQASLERGCVVSVTPWGTGPIGWTFRARNPLIAALSKILVVCEASMPSGTISTAEAAIDLDRRVYAAPGSIFSTYAKGTNWLLEQGAEIIADEVSLEMALSMEYDVFRLQSQLEQDGRGRLLEALVAEPMRPDEAARRLGLDLVTVLQTLGDYEAKGFVLRLPDGCYAPTEKALTGEGGDA